MNKPPHQQNTQWFQVTFSGTEHRVHPIDGELIGKGPGLSHGWVHLMNRACVVVGVCGVTWFDEHAIPLVPDQPKANLALTLDAYEVVNLRWMMHLVGNWANTGDWFHQIQNQLDAFDCGDTGPNG